MTRCSRRSLLSSLAAALVAVPAGAIGPRSEVSIGRLRLGAGADARPEALRRLLWETAKRTSIETARDAVEVAPEDDELFYQPLLVWTGAGSVPPLTPEVRARIARHLRFGGMLWIDGQEPGDGFVDAAKRELAAALPATTFAPLPTDHVLFRSFFLLEGAAGRREAPREVSAVTLADRLAVIVTETDVLGAYERDRFGTWRYDCAPGGDRQREQAFRFGVNVVMYATCLDYKADQVHIPFIMKKTRR